MLLLATAVVLRVQLSYGLLPANALAGINFAGGMSAMALLLAVLPTQERVIWYTTIAEVVAMLATSVAPVPCFVETFADPAAGPAEDDTLPVWFIRTLSGIQLASFILADLRFVFKLLYPLLRREPPRRRLEIMWRTFAETSLCYSARDAVLFCLHASTGIVAPGAYWGRLWDCAAWAALSALCMCSRLRSKVQALLAERGERATAALVVGALLGSRPLHDLLRMSKEHFRCVSLDRVTKDMVDENTPNPELFALTEHVDLGDGDAFVSHSWHDDTDEKWEALQEWRREFKAAMGREPRVWFDRFSIDQTNVRDSLAGLPIYLAGCNSLLVLMGGTYTTRLWCLIELFTFIVMGGKQAQLVVKRLPSCTEGFDALDVRKATCSVAEDSSRLISIIEDGFGSVDSFNTQVQSLRSECASLKGAQMP